MRKISLMILGIFTSLTFAAEEQNLNNIDKLDVLDKQSKEFFKAITGLEKDYLEEQITAIKTKKDEPTSALNNNPQQAGMIKEVLEVSAEDYEKNVFKHQNEMARLTTDFTRTKKLKDIKIKSMYSFNGKDYVVLELDEKKAANKSDELTSSIEGRYIEGDSILGHKIVTINTRTKNLELYKKLDEDYGYYIYLSNYGISVGDLEKIVKVEEKDSKNKTDKNAKKKDEKKILISENNDNKIKEAFSQVKNKELVKLNKKELENCLYTVNVSNLNVRNDNEENATILRVLKKNDQFIIQEKNSSWVKLNTIYKKKSGDVMVVDNENNWLQIVNENVSAIDKNCL